MNRLLIQKGQLKKPKLTQTMADPATPPAVSFLVKKEKSEKESGLSGGGGGASSPKQSKKGK